MEQMPNEDVKLPQRRRRKPQKKGFDLAALFSWVGKDAPWYYDIRLWSPLILLVLILALALPAKNRSDSRTVTQAEEPTVAETQAATEEAPTEAPVNQEAAALARLADSVGSGLPSTAAKTAAMATARACWMRSPAPTSGRAMTKTSPTASILTKSPWTCWPPRPAAACAPWTATCSGWCSMMTAPSPCATSSPPAPTRNGGKKP